MTGRDDLKRRVTIKDIAKAAKVSIASVSFVLNGTGSVGAEVRERVLRTARALGYRVNQRASAMRTGRSQTIGLVVPDISNPFFPGLAQAVEEAAREAGYAVLLADSANGAREREGLDRLERHGVDGICWCPSTQTDVARELNLSMPIVLVCRPLEGYDLVMSSERGGAAAIWDHVNRAGYRRVGLIRGVGDIPGARERGDSLRALMFAKGVLRWEVETHHSLAIEDALAEILSQSDVDVVICPNDIVAIGVMRHLVRCGRRVPEDVAVIGFDDIAWASIVSPPLSTVRQPVAGLGHEAVAMLIDRIARPQGSRRTTLLDVQFVARESTCSVASEADVIAA